MTPGVAITVSSESALVCVPACLRVCLRGVAQQTAGTAAAAAAATAEGTAVGVLPYDVQALQRYILLCCQQDSGGLCN